MMTSDILDRLSTLGTVKIDEPMSCHTSFKTGGPADMLIVPDEPGSLAEIVDTITGNKIPVTIVGGCSNLLVGDRGIRGAVIKICEEKGNPGKIKIEGDLVYSDACVKKGRFIGFCLENGLEGMEFMSGIPGCLGGGIIMNAGITEAVFADILNSVVYIDMKGNTGAVNINKSKAGYRNIGIEADVIVLGGYFRLKKTADAPNLKRKIEGYIAERKIKHPLDWPSAGSVFKNPPGYSSWKLIDESGLKGRRVGGAQVSELHTNFIINTGGATSSDILNLVDCIRNVVFSKTGIQLEAEIKMLGEF